MRRHPCTFPGTFLQVITHERLQLIGRKPVAQRGPLETHERCNQLLEPKCAHAPARLGEIAYDQLSLGEDQRQSPVRAAVPEDWQSLRARGILPCVHHPVMAVEGLEWVEAVGNGVVLPSVSIG